MKNNWFTHLILVAFVIVGNSCNTAEKKEDTTNENSQTQSSTDKKKAGSLKFAGPFSNGMKGDSIFFTVSEDGKKLTDLTFKGYWRCNGKLEQTTVGPEGSFEISNGTVNGSLVEPPDGGSTAWRFELQTDIKGNEAEGSFRMNINNLGCDTYKLNFKAVAQ